MRLVALITSRHVVQDLWGTILVLNTPRSHISSIREGMLCLQVKVIVLHHAVVMTLLTVSSRMRHCGLG